MWCRNSNCLSHDHTCINDMLWPRYICVSSPFFFHSAVFSTQKSGGLNELMASSELHFIKVSYQAMWGIDLSVPLKGHGSTGNSGNNWKRIYWQDSDPKFLRAFPSFLVVGSQLKRVVLIIFFNLWHIVTISFCKASLNFTYIHSLLSPICPPLLLLPHTIGVMGLTYKMPVNCASFSVCVINF